MSYDSDKAAARCSRLWRSLGELYAKAADEALQAINPDRAMKCARMADVCFWQATGEFDSISMDDVVPKPPAT